jgi:hypothetical protein
MSVSRDFELLRAKYRAQWDAYQIIAYRNLTRLKDGKRISDADAVAELQAAEAVRLAREAMRSAMGRGGD